MSEILMGFWRNTPVDRHCTGCGTIVGPSSPYYKAGFEVREGVVTGFFHSKQCYLNKLKEAGESLDGQEVT